MIGFKSYNWPLIQFYIRSTCSSLHCCFQLHSKCKGNYVHFNDLKEYNQNEIHKKIKTIYSISQEMAPYKKSYCVSVISDELQWLSCISGRFCTCCVKPVSPFSHHLVIFTFVPIVEFCENHYNQFAVNMLGNFQLVDI